MKKTTPKITQNAPQNTLDITIIQGEMNPLLTKAKCVQITSTHDMESATEYLSQLNIAKDKVTERMETITAPAKETIKAAEAIWKPFITAAKEAIQLLRDKQSLYQTNLVKHAREADQKIITDINAGTIDLTQALESSPNSPVKEIYAPSGSIRFREDKQFEITDIKLLPIQYHLANEVSIRVAMKNGIELPGVRYFTVQIPVNRR